MKCNFCVIVLFFFSLVGCNQNNFVPNENEMPVTTKSTNDGELAWNYPMQYGTPGWADLETVEEQFNAYNIPDEILKTVSTEELVKICFAYPEWGLINAYNSRRTGFFVLVDLFNGFQELFRREDAATALMNEYAKIDPFAVNQAWTDLEKGQYAFQLTKIEMILNERVMISKLDNYGLEILKELATSVYQRKKMLPNIYSIWDLCPTAGICANIVDLKNATLFEARRAEVNYFMYYLMVGEISLLDYIVELVK